jgi:hypothetical protein
MNALPLYKEKYGFSSGGFLTFQKGGDKLKCIEKGSKKR